MQTSKLYIIDYFQEIDYITDKKGNPVEDENGLFIEIAKLKKAICDTNRRIIKVIESGIEPGLYKEQTLKNLNLI